MVKRIIVVMVVFLSIGSNGFCGQKDSCWTITTIDGKKIQTTHFYNQKHMGGSRNDFRCYVNDSKMDINDYDIKTIRIDKTDEEWAYGLITSTSGETGEFRMWHESDLCFKSSFGEGCYDIKQIKSLDACR